MGQSRDKVQSPSWRFKSRVSLWYMLMLQKSCTSRYDKFPMIHKVLATSFRVVVLDPSINIMFCSSLFGTFWRSTCLNLPHNICLANVPVAVVSPDPQFPTMGRISNSVSDRQFPFRMLGVIFIPKQKTTMNHDNRLSCYLIHVYWGLPKACNSG